MTITLSRLDTAVVCAAVGWLGYLLTSGRSHGTLPPSPKLTPVIGTVRQMMSKQIWLVVQRWGVELGDVVYLSVWGQPLLFLNSRHAALELLDKRGAIYSDRPRMVMGGELCGCADMVAFTSYGNQFKRHRRLFTSAFGPQHIPAYRPLMLDATLDIIHRLIDTPEQFQSHFRRYAGGLALQVVYGYRPSTTGSDDFLELAEECMDLLANRISPSGSVWLVDVIPQLKMLPSWFPGASFKRMARQWKPRMEAFVNLPYSWVKSMVASGNATTSFCATVIEDKREKMTEQFEHDLKWVANSMYAASADTTIGTMSHFVLAMTQHPEILQRAQKEIDRVTGNERLPTFEDRANLPYVDAIVSETLRYASPTPLGLPHRLSQDDVYENQFIPKGTLVFANIWALLQDPEIYPEPSTFKPDRFLNLSEERFAVMDPRNYVFGFGRRICPGEHMVDSSVWLLIACMIATLDIRKAKDVAGNTIEPVVEYPNSVFRTPAPFECSITPRSEKAIAVLGEA
ncbi:cytochrome P450 [Peniophora sp. CONT]|nr:cytochrome P450 [Peniophora sp. CONT]